MTFNPRHSPVLKYLGIYYLFVCILYILQLINTYTINPTGINKVYCYCYCMSLEEIILLVIFIRFTSLCPTSKVLVSLLIYLCSLSCSTCQCALLSDSTHVKLNTLLGSTSVDVHFYVKQYICPFLSVIVSANFTSLWNRTSVSFYLCISHCVCQFHFSVRQYIGFYLCICDYVSQFHISVWQCTCQF